MSKRIMLTDDEMVYLVGTIQESLKYEKFTTDNGYRIGGKLFLKQLLRKVSNDPS